MIGHSIEDVAPDEMQRHYLTMYLESELYLIEEGFWLQGRDHFLAHLDDQCLLAFPQAGEMHGILGRKGVAVTATPSNRWRDLKMYDRRLLEVGEVAIISYRADVTRADGQPYAALVSSGYVRGSRQFHQHSPVSLQDRDQVRVRRRIHQ